MTLPISPDEVEDAAPPAPLTKREGDLIARLSAKLRRSQADLRRFGDYYDGLQKLAQLGLAVPPELEDFTVIVNWPRVVADSLEERIDLEGFRLPGEYRRNPELWRVWQANNLDEESQLAHLDAIVYGRSYICVGTNEDDENTPIVTVESPMEMTAEISPRTRRVTAALRNYRDTDDDGLLVERAVLYLKNETIWVEKRWTGANRGWTVTARDQHDLGRVPVVPLVNRARVGDRDGISELADVISLTDAAARALTLAQLATEALSVPQKLLLGVTEEDFIDPETGKVLPKWQAYFGAVWGLENENAKVHQFNAADLANFDKIVTLYATQVSSVTGLPLRFFGQNTANPPSEGAITADETRLVKRAERRHRAWGGDWEDVARLIKLFVAGAVPDEWVELESIWRDASTPTEAQTADAVVKKVQVGILPIEAAWEDLGYSQTRIDQLRALRDKQLADTDVLARQLNAYRQAPPGDAETSGGTSGTPDASPAAQGL